MALKFSVEKLDDVDEAFRPLYVEKDGKFVLDAEGIPAPSDDTGLKTALQKERKAREDLEKQVKKWQRLGKSDAEIEAMIADAAKAEEEKATKAGEWDKLKAQMNAKHADDLRSADEKVSAMKRALERHLVDAQATAAIAAAKGVPDLLLPHVQKHVKVVEENGEFKVVVTDVKGDPRVDGKGEPLSISDLVVEMRGSDIFGRAFEGTGSSGSGTPPQNKGGGNPSGKRRSEFKDEKERSDFVNAHGLAAYQALPA